MTSKYIAKFVKCIACCTKHTITFSKKEINKQVICPYCGAYNIHNRPKK